MIIFCILMALGQCHPSNYEIPSYYGHFSEDFLQYQNLSKGEFSYLELSTAITLSYDNLTMFYANRQQHCILKATLNNISINRFVGICGKSGNINGKRSDAHFDGVSSVAYYQPNEGKRKQAQYAKLIYVQNRQCDPSLKSCRIANPQLTNLTIENIKLYPQIQLFPTKNDQEQSLFIADTNNHCIKRLSITHQSIVVIAGQCGQSGFKDGPLGISRLNKPSRIGVDSLGVVFFFDEGNQYIRKINVNGSVETMINGACRYYGKGRRVKNYSLRHILCYSNWVEYATSSLVQHYFNPNLDICLEHSSKCQQSSL